MKWVNWGAVEIEMLVKPPSLIVDRVDHDRPDPTDVRRLFNPLQCIEQESFPKSLSFLGDVHRQASEQDDPYRVVREPFGNSLRGPCLWTEPALSA